jgi:hypothetical protein
MRSRRFDSAPDESFDDQSRDEILETLLEQTKHYLDKDSFHQRFTQHVREHRLTSKFDFENLSELVRCVLERTKIKQLPVDYEECVNWIATCIYEDPLTNERAARFWNSIINRIQG